MFIREFEEETRHTRRSKSGRKHSYRRTKTIVVLRCDNCDIEFSRERARTHMGLQISNLKIYKLV